MNLTPALIKAIAQLFSSAVQTLDRSTAGWWRLIVVLGFLWFFVITYKAAEKIDPAKMFEGRRPEHDCPVVDGQWNCDQ